MTLDPRMSLESRILRLRYTYMNMRGNPSAFQEHLRGESFYQTGCSGHISAYGVNGPSNSVGIAAASLKQWRFASFSKFGNAAKRQKPQPYPERGHEDNGFYDKPSLGARQAYKST
jgi:hypothetical protein